MTKAAPQTLRDFNELLEQANLPRLSAQQFESLRAAKPRNQLLSAVTTMQSDPNALAFINRALQQVCGVTVETSPAANSAPRPSAPPQPDFGPSPTPEPAQPELATQPAASQGQQAPLADNERGASEFEYTMHVYGGKAALCFEPTTTRGDDFTVALDSASSTAPRQYDWKNKLRVQTTRDELPVVAGVLLGLIPRCEYKNHGPNNDKGFSIEDQGNKLFVRTWAKDHPARAVPITPEDAYRIATLFLRQLGLNAPWMSASDIIQTIRMVVARRMAG